MTDCELSALVVAGPATPDRVKKLLRHTTNPQRLESAIALIHPPSLAQAWRLLLVNYLPSATADPTGTP